MVSIAQVVEQIIEEKPFLETALGFGILNYTRLAEELLPEVENRIELSGKEVTVSAVMMSIRRLAERLSNQFDELSGLFSKQLSLEMDYSKYNLFSFTVRKTPEVNELVKQLYDIVDLGKRDYLTITSGITEVTIISNSRYRDQMLSLFDRSQVLNIDNDLASISLIIPQDSFQNPGLFYLVTKQLYWDGINIREVVSTLTEMNFIVKEIDIPSSLVSLRKLLGD